MIEPETDCESDEPYQAFIYPFMYSYSDCYFALVCFGLLRFTSIYFGLLSFALLRFAFPCFMSCLPDPPPLSPLWPAPHIICLWIADPTSTKPASVTSHRRPESAPPHLAWEPRIPPEWTQGRVRMYIALPLARRPKPLISSHSSSCPPRPASFSPKISRYRLANCICTASHGHGKRR